MKNALKALYDKFRKQPRLTIGKDPWAKLADCNQIIITEEDKRNVSLGILGEGNTVHIGKLAAGCPGNINISLVGKGCTVILEEGLWVAQQLTILAGLNHPCFGLIENTVIHIRRATSFENTVIITYNSNCQIDIGERCMFSYGVTIYHTDAHPIYDLGSGNTINKVNTLKIGDHCWIGANASLLKNVELGHDTIVGWGSVVRGKFYSSCNLPSPPTNCILAGNPATVVKTGVTWDSNSNNGYIQNEPCEKENC